MKNASFILSLALLSACSHLNDEVNAVSTNVARQPAQEMAAPKIVIGSDSVASLTHFDELKRVIDLHAHDLVYCYQKEIAGAYSYIYSQPFDLELVVSTKGRVSVEKDIAVKENNPTWKRLPQVHQSNQQCLREQFQKFRFPPYPSAIDLNVEITY